MNDMRTGKVVTLSGKIKMILEWKRHSIYIQWDSKAANWLCRILRSL
jgi:hypothetical protein